MKDFLNRYMASNRNLKRQSEEELRTTFESVTRSTSEIQSPTVSPLVLLLAAFVSITRKSPASLTTSVRYVARVVQRYSDWNTPQTRSLRLTG
jgi:hypothetical protein